MPSYPLPFVTLAWTGFIHDKISPNAINVKAIFPRHHKFYISEVSILLPQTSFLLIYKTLFLFLLYKIFITFMVFIPM